VQTLQTEIAEICFQWAIATRAASDKRVSAPAASGDRLRFFGSVSRIQSHRFNVFTSTRASTRIDVSRISFDIPARWISGNVLLSSLLPRVHFHEKSASTSPPSLFLSLSLVLQALFHLLDRLSPTRSINRPAIHASSLSHYCHANISRAEKVQALSATRPYRKSGEE